MADVDAVTAKKLMWLAVVVAGLALAALVAVVVSQGGEPAAAPDDAVAAAPTEDSEPPVVTAEEIAQKTGCSGITPSEGGQLSGMAESVDCTLGDLEISVGTFAENEGRDAFVEMARAFGGLRVVGDRFVVQCTKNDGTSNCSRTEMEPIAAAVGGTVKA